MPPLKAAYILSSLTISARCSSLLPECPLREMPPSTVARRGKYYDLVLCFGIRGSTSFCIVRLLAFAPVVPLFWDS